MKNEINNTSKKEGGNRRMKKRVLSILVSIVLVMQMILPSFAMETEAKTVENLPSEVITSAPCNNNGGGSVMEDISGLFNPDLQTETFDKYFSWDWVGPGSKETRWPIYILAKYDNPIVINSYTFRMGGDEPGRDPKKWEVFGVNAKTPIDTSKLVASGDPMQISKDTFEKVIKDNKFESIDKIIDGDKRIPGDPLMHGTDDENSDGSRLENTTFDLDVPKVCNYIIFRFDEVKDLESCTYSGLQLARILFESNPATAVSITGSGESDTFKIGAGKKTRLNATVLPETALQDVNWSSSNEEVATVDENGVVTGISDGEVTITATTVAKDETGNPKTISIQRNVVKEPHELGAPDLEEISANYVNVDFDMDTAENDNIDDIIKSDVWDNAEEFNPGRKNPFESYQEDDVDARAMYKVLWDEDYIYVMADVQDPKDALVTTGADHQQDSLEFFMNEDATAEGSDAYDATKGGKAAQYRVNSQGKISWGRGGAHERFKALAKQVDGGYVVVARIAFHDSDKVNADEVQFELQLNVAKEQDERKGTLNLLGTGDGYNDVSDFGTLTLVRELVEEISINPTESTLTAGDSETLIATVTENATNKKLKWTSDNNDVVTVIADKTDGTKATIKAKTAGNATITAEALDGSEVKGTCEVTVNAKAVATSISVNKKEIKFDAPGGSEQLTATIVPNDATNKAIRWTTSNASVATVSEEGLVTAVAGGTATITVAVQGTTIKDTCVVSVKQMATGVTINPKTLSLEESKTQRLTVSVTPSTATEKNVIWISSDDNVATVAANGYVTAVKVGTATIIATVQGTEIKAECTVTVTQKVIPQVLVEEVTISPKTLSLDAGKAQKLEVTVSPADASNTAVTWISSNQNVATVGTDGTVTALAAGTATITATAQDDSGTSDTCIVTVISTSSSSYKISYVLNSGTNSKANPATYNKGVTVTFKNATRAGYQFSGWYTDSGLKTKITSVKDKDITVYAKWVKVSVAKPSIKNLKNNKSKQVKLTIKKVSGANGYTLLYAQDKKFKKNKKTALMKNVSSNIKKLKKGKTYFFKVRAYKIDSTGKKIYGKYSSQKKLKIRN